MNTTELNGKQYTMKVNADETITLVPVVAEDGDWVPKRGDNYWYVGEFGVASEFSRSVDAAAFVPFGNSYRTKHEAEKASTLMRRSNAIIRACMLVDTDAGVCSGDRKWSPALELGRWMENRWTMTNHYHFPACVHTQEQCKLAAALLNKWGVK